MHNRLLSLDPDQFTQVVDDDLRGNASHSDHRALRGPAVLPRWRHELERMRASVCGTIEARDDEAEANRLDALLAGDKRLATEIERDHLRWRAGAVRFRTGLFGALSEVETTTSWS